MVTPNDYKVAVSTKEYQEVYEVDRPLVSICIPTFNRADLLFNRSLKSAVNQTYTNLEIIVIGDCCTDHTEEVVRQFHDPRIVFYNLSKRGEYPQDPLSRWLVAGSIPKNLSFRLATGHFIAHLDDDDEFILNKIEKLVEFAKQTRADFIYHPFDYRNKVWGQGPLELCSVTTSAMFHHHWLKCIRSDPQAYLLNEPGDWNKVRRMLELGIKTAHYPEVLTLKYE